MEQYTLERLKELQSLSLDEKIEISQNRIEDWYMQFYGNVYVSFSGGKDSTVLLHLVREMFPEVPAVFFDTGLEYPELRQFVSKIPNVRFIKPKMTFIEVIKVYGYPIVSKEVAEAIYFARKSEKEDCSRKQQLCKKSGGGATAKQKIKELTGQRMYGGGVRKAYTIRKNGLNLLFMHHIRLAIYAVM